MSFQADKALQFKALHKPGDPIILFNVWDADSAKAVAGEGATAIATSHHAIANSYGYEDGESMPLELDFANMKRIVEAVDLPVTVDFESGYGRTPEEVKASVARALETGIVGINLEDRGEADGQLRGLDDACARIAAARSAADEAGIDLFINARTNRFFYATDEEKPSEALVDELIERAKAFSEAGASGYFVPGLTNLDHIKKLCDASSLPVNIIWLPGFPPVRDIAAAGAARISYGPGPYLAMIEWLKVGAKRAFALQD